MSRSRWFALLAATALALPLPAQAAPQKRLAVYNLFGPMSLLGISGLLTKQAVDQAKAQGYQVLGPDDAEARVGRDTLKKLRECDLKAQCLASYSGALGGGKLLAGTLERDDVHYLVRLVIVDLDTGQVYASAQRAVLIASRDLEREFDAMLPGLFAGKNSAPTRLTLTSPRKHVRAFVDDKPVGELPQTVEISPGHHEVRAEKKDYLPIDQFVELAPGATTTLNLPLTLMPNKIDPDEPIAETTVHQAPGTAQAAPEPESKGVPVASWVALGTAVAAAGAGTYFALSENSIAGRAKDANGDGALDITRTEALSARRDATFANVSFVVAGVAAATGVVLWLTSDGGDGEKPKTSTTVGLAPLPGLGAAASVSGSF